MPTFRTLLRRLIPPLIWDVARRSAVRPPHMGPALSLTYLPDGWVFPNATSVATGWNEASVLDFHKASWPQFVAALEGPKPLGIAPEASAMTNENLVFHNTIMSFAYVLALAAHGKQRISLLDWGGGIGHYYLIAKAALPGVEIDYHCKEVPALAEYGQQLFPEAHFYSDDEAYAGHQYDLVMASG